VTLASIWTPNTGCAGAVREATAGVDALAPITPAPAVAEVAPWPHSESATLRLGRPLGSVVVEYAWRGTFGSDEVEQLHAEGFGREPDYAYDWVGQVEGHSLGWACARQGSRLVGWVNVAWDGFAHAFLLDTIVSADCRRDGIGTTLVQLATEAARNAGCEWLHVDFEDHLEAFYVEACGFRPTNAGLIAL
jgi:ribosomal protein S18 acetylase RimI-like enzyme